MRLLMYTTKKGSGIKWTSKDSVPDDEMIETFEIDDNECTYAHVIEMCNAREEACKKYVKEKELKKLEKKKKTALKVDEAKVEKRVLTMRNLRIGEDTAKFYGGDNQNRVSGQALKLKQLNNKHAQETFELWYKNFKINKANNKERLKSQVKQETIVEKYGNAAAGDALPRELLLGQSEREVEYDRAGRIIKGQEMSLPKCFIRNSYCTAAAGIEAATDVVKANIASKQATKDVVALTEEKQLATWGIHTPNDLVLDQETLAESLKKDDKKKREEKDENNVKCNDDDVTVDDM
ncbi:pre-mRNA-splicing factor SLU7-like [Rutidosis leptorrhynchoides]|uniref:pre-mRNA-splicing factor SLU7-like n=1 Tax=Rutidosis leptorrhynchoides TaxID=125765 RepID=UPI003A9A58E3